MSLNFLFSRLKVPGVLFQDMTSHQGVIAWEGPTQAMRSSCWRDGAGIISPGPEPHSGSNTILQQSEGNGEKTNKNGWYFKSSPHAWVCMGVKLMVTPISTGVPSSGRSSEGEQKSHVSGTV